jgi:hypothetical protein
VSQRIEGQNMIDLAWGTANAQSVTLSFKVYSSLTGTFGGCITNAAYDQSYPFTYSIPVANTWTNITLTIPGATAGSWLTTNYIFATVFWGLGVGSTNSGTAGAWASTGYTSATGATSVVGTSGATFYITGVQLEKGSTATSFDYRPYGTELALCQRYYTSTSAIPAYMNGSGAIIVFGFYLPSAFRATPSISYIGTVSIIIPGVNTYSSTTQPSSISTPNAQNNQAIFSITGFGTTVASGAGSLGGAAINFSAEL